MVTPLFVHAYGWWHACVNGIAAIIFCPLAERLYGKKVWALYFIPGVVGQMFGYLWSPYLAGSSLGIAGVMGGLLAYVVLHRRELSGSATHLSRGLIDLLKFVEALVSENKAWCRGWESNPPRITSKLSSSIKGGLTAFTFTMVVYWV